MWHYLPNNSQQSISDSLQSMMWVLVSLPIISFLQLCCQLPWTWEGKHAGSVREEILETDEKDQTHERQRDPLGLFHSFKANCSGNGMNKGGTPGLEAFPKHIFRHWLDSVCLTTGVSGLWDDFQFVLFVHICFRLCLTFAAFSSFLVKVPFCLVHGVKGFLS